MTERRARTASPSRSGRGHVRAPGVSIVVALAWFGFAPAVAAQPAGPPAPAPSASKKQALSPEGEQDLSSQATDPTASLMSFNFINGFTTAYYGIDDSGYEFKFQPVIPFRAWGANNILRVVVPYRVSGPGEEGLKSVTIFDLLVFPQSWGRFAIGPVMSLVESTSGAPSKFAVGPAVGVMKPISKRLNTGLFTQNLFAGHVGITQIQPIVAYQLGHGWALSAGDLQFTYDWELGTWVQVPLGFQIGAVRSVGGQPMRFALNPQYNFRDLTGADKFKLTFTVTLLAPAK